MLLLPLFAISLGLIGWLSYFISSKSYKGIYNGQNKGWATFWSVIIFIGCFGLLFITEAFIILSNIKFER